MKNTKHSMPYNLGKVEFNNLFSEIISMYILGHTRSFIYRKLIEESKITMSYNTFCYHMRKYDKKNGEKEGKQETVIVEKKEIRVPKTVAVGESKFKSPDYYKDEKLA